MTAEGLLRACSVLDVSPLVLWAVLDVETAGCGFFQDRRPVILFERHIFHRLTNGAYYDSNPDICNPQPGKYGAAGANQYVRLLAAYELDPDAALQSASWGIGQVMGFNARICGYTNAVRMAEEFAASEDNQLYGMSLFMKVRGLDVFLRDKDWAAFARGYNGIDYRRNRYDERLEAAHARRGRIGLPDLSIRALQIRLFFDGKYMAAIDGLYGPATRRAEGL